MLKLLLKITSENSGVAEKLIANSVELRLIIEGKINDLRPFTGWRYDIFGKYAQSLINGELAITYKNGVIKILSI